RLQILNRQLIDIQWLRAFRTPESCCLHIKWKNTFDRVSNRSDRFIIRIDPFWLNSLYGNARRFRTDNFLRRQYTMAQHFPNSRSRNIDPVAFIMWACLFCSKAVTACAIKYLIKQTYVNAHFFRCKFIKNRMARLFFIRIADSRMIPTDERVCATIIFLDQRMQYRLTRTSKYISNPQR